MVGIAAYPQGRITAGEKGSVMHQQRRVYSQEEAEEAVTQIGRLPDAAAFVGTTRQVVVTGIGDVLDLLRLATQGFERRSVTLTWDQ